MINSLYPEVLIILCAIISGAEAWTHVAEYGRSKEEWFSLHWCLDVSFREDLCRVRKDHAPENFGILRHMAMNLLKQEKFFKGGIKAKRLKASWDHKYLLKLLAG